MLLVAQRLYPNPRDLEVETVALKGEGLPRVFWIYLGAVALVAAGACRFSSYCPSLPEDRGKLISQKPLIIENSSSS